MLEHGVPGWQAKEPIEGKLVMEDSPVYDKAYTDVQVVSQILFLLEP